MATISFYLRIILRLIHKIKSFLQNIILFQLSLENTIRQKKLNKLYIKMILSLILLNFLKVVSLIKIKRKILELSMKQIRKIELSILHQFKMHKIVQIVKIIRKIF
jgi:hypothetical protein